MEGRKEGEREREKRIPLTPSPPQATHSLQLANKASYHSFLIPQLNSRTFHVPPQSSLSSFLYLSGSAENSSTFLTSVQRRHSALRPYIWGQEQSAILPCIVRGWYVRPHTSGLYQSQRARTGEVSELEANVLLWPLCWGAHTWMHVVPIIWNTSWKHQEPKRAAARWHLQGAQLLSLLSLPRTSCTHRWHK